MDTDLLQILACPRCRGDLNLIRQEDVDAGLGCPACKLVYPIKEDIPVLLVSAAIPEQSWAMAAKDAFNK